MSLDIEKEIASAIELIPSDVRLADETLPIASSSIEEINRDYGPGSPDRRLFHDAPHSIGGIRRDIIVTNLLFPYIPPVHQGHIYDLAIVGPAVHDRYQDRGPNNEADSAEFGVAKIEEADGVLNTSFNKQRLRHGVGATAVKIEANGRIVQPNMRRGARDPYKFIMGFSDKNGIAIEGDERMWTDAPNVYFEKTPPEEQTVEGLLAFCGSGQVQFLRQGLNDPLIKADIAYHFGSAAPEVYDALYGAFHQNIVEAFNQAQQLHDQPELQQILGQLLRPFDRLLIQPLAGSLIRRMVRRDS